jgi:hypothetical protein
MAIVSTDSGVSLSQQSSSHVSNQVIGNGQPSSEATIQVICVSVFSYGCFLCLFIHKSTYSFWF